MQAQGEAKGFFAALFDFGFTSFITLKFLKVIYAVLVGLILLGGLISFFALLSRGGFFVVLALVVAPVVTLVYLVLARVSLEAVALFFRIGENTSIMAGQASMTGGSPMGDGPLGGSPWGGPAGPYPSGPPSIH